MISALIQIILFILPWPARKILLSRLINLSIEDGGRIGLSIILCKKTSLAARARIKHLTLIKGLDHLQLGNHSLIGNLNWITGFPTNTKSAHYKSETDRKPQLIIGNHSAITSRHLIDCTGGVFIGSFTTFAGFRSQILTHSIDIKLSRQCSKSLRIGDYCFVGTGSILLPGSNLPNYSILAAGSVLNKYFDQNHMLYAGNPAKAVKELDQTSLYFLRKNGFVN